MDNYKENLMSYISNKMPDELSTVSVESMTDLSWLLLLMQTVVGLVDETKELGQLHNSFRCNGTDYLTCL